MAESIQSATTRARTAPDEIIAWMPDPEHRMCQRVHEILKFAHARNAIAPINRPDEQGGFVSSSLAGATLGRGVPPIVADANRLRENVLYSCRTGRRTVLITAANSGATRIYCASHVLEEVAEHAREWTERSAGVSLGSFLEQWESEYLPLIREVQDGEIPLGVLNPVELERLAQLHLKDPDDVPSATLALALGAFFLSDDRAALRAVYGYDLDLDDHRAWVDLLKAGGDASELGTMMFSVVMIPTIVGAGLFEVGRWLASTYSPWLLLGIGCGATLLSTRIAPDKRDKLRSGLRDAGTAFSYMYAQYEAAFERFLTAAPAIPSWAALAQTNDRRMVLARGALHELARATDSPVSAHDLARALPSLHVAQGEQLVRETLRAHACFGQPYDGRWQVGHAVLPPVPLAYASPSQAHAPAVRAQLDSRVERPDRGG
jgi:predicted nucleic acid-binding protein